MAAKREFIDRMCKDHDISIHEAKIASERVADTILNLLRDGEEARLHPIGVFIPEIVPAHTRMNNLTGKNVDVPIRAKVKFKLSASISDMVKELCNKL